MDKIINTLLIELATGNVLGNVCYENIVTDHLTAQLLCSCSELFWHMQSRLPHGVAQLHHVQIRNLRVAHSSPLCLVIDV